MALRLGLAVTVAAVGALVGLAGFDLAIGPMTELLGLPRAVVAAGLAFVLVLVAAPGGVSGIVWAANGAAGVLLAALALPSGLLLARGDMPSFFSASPLWRAGADQILFWQSQSAQEGGGIVAGFPAFLGALVAAAALAPLLTAPAAARDGRSALRAGGAGARLERSPGPAGDGDGPVGQRHLLARRHRQDARPPARRDLFREHGGLRGHLRRPVLLAPPPRAPSARTVARRPRPCPSRMRGREPPCSSPTSPARRARARPGVGLLAAALLAVGLTVAAAGFLLCATALGHDLFYRVRSRQAQTSRRLAVTRALLVATVALGAAVTGARNLDARLLIGLAATLAAAAILPLLVLSVHPRAIGRDAVIALLVGLARRGGRAVRAGADARRAASRGVWRARSPASSRASRPARSCRGDRSESRAFVDALLHATGDVLAPDKGA